MSSHSPAGVRTRRTNSFLSRTVRQATQLRCGMCRCFTRQSGSRTRFSSAVSVQRGCIWLQGGSSNCRNLLDFNDITIDKEGRVLVAYADGCTDACVTNPASTKKTDLGVIARQESGLGLLSAYDSVLGGAPAVRATRFSAKVHAPSAKRNGERA